MKTPISSAIYSGRLSHCRHGPTPHAFSYRLYMLYLDLDELDFVEYPGLFGIERRSLLSFHRRDFFGDAKKPLKQSILDALEERTGLQLNGPVRMLTHVRSLGYIFNPVTFYYCFSRREKLEAVVAEITNTPWGERHAYFLPVDAEGNIKNFTKQFHVSPFFPMEQQYQWKLSTPGDNLRVRTDNYEKDKLVFGARLDLDRQDFTKKNLMRVLLIHPWMAASVHLAIYFHALRLLLKRTPFFSHPKKMQEMTK